MYKIKLIPHYCDDFPRDRIEQVLFNLFENCPNLQVLSFDKINVSCVCHFSLIAMPFFSYLYTLIQTGLQRLQQLW